MAERADPEQIQTRDDLGRELTVLRAAAGLTVRDLAKRIDAPVATLGDYFAGRHLPGPRQIPLFRAILTACGVQDPDAMERWLVALARVRLATDGRSAKGPAPYRGLDPFTEADTDLFFGRRSAVDELLGHLRAVRDAAPGTGGALAVVGASGAGKTSLFLAGLIAAIRQGLLDDGERRWEARLLTTDQLVSGVGFSWPSDPDIGRVAVIDQFETVLTLPAERRIAALSTLTRLQRTCLVVIGVRADFYHEVVAEPSLLAALRNQMILGPMTAEQLREVIVGPLRQVGAGIDDGLVELILADLAPGSSPGYAHEPGSLPLLSYALLATWERAPHNQLTVADYQAAGGLRGAVRLAAENVYGGLSPAEQAEARRMFSRLVRVDDDGPPTRRRAARSELDGGPDAHDTHPASDLARSPDAHDGQRAPESPDGYRPTVLERFVAARLLTADAQNIQISHEVLLSAWPRLSEWVSADRHWLRVHHQVADAAQAWADGNHDESLLWRGGRLESAQELAAAPGHQQELNRAESEFLARSSSQQHELERARRRRVRRTQQLLGVVGVLAVVAAVLAAVAINADIGANQARDQALSRQVAVESQQLRPTDPSLAAQLALAAYRISPTVQASSTLVDATAGEIPTRLVGPVGPEFAATSGDGNLLAVAQSADDTVALYRLSSGRPVKVAQVRAGAASAQDYAIAVSPDGDLVAAGTTAGTVRIWSLHDLKRPAELATISGLKSTVYSLAFGPAAQSLAAADSDGTVHLWNLGDPRQPTAADVLSVPGDTALKAVAYSPDGNLLAAAGDDGVLAVWRGGDPTAVLATGTSGTDFQALAFSPRGTMLAVGVGNAQTTEVFDVSATGGLTLTHGPFHVATSEVNIVAFSPDGSILADGASDGTVELYSTTTWTPISTFSNPDPVTGVVFGPGGRTLISADSGGVTRIWRLPPPSTETEPGNVYSLSYSGSGKYLSASDAGPTGGVTIWDDADPLHPARLVDVPLPAGFGAGDGAAAISPDGDVLAVANNTAWIQLFDIADPAEPVPIGAPLHGNKPYIEQLSFSPSGKLLLAGDDSGQVRVWNVQRPSRPVALASVLGAHGQVLGFAMNPGSTILATASSDKKVRIYDVARPTHPKLLATVGGFASYVYDAAITPDGRTLIAGSADGTIRMWTIADPSHPVLLGRPLSIPTGYVFQLAVSPDGHTLAAASTTAAVWLWTIADPSRPQLLDDLSAAQDEVFTVRFTPDGRVLAASGSDDTLHFWDYRPAAAARDVCSSAGAPISRAEWSQYVQGAAYRPPCP